MPLPNNFSAGRVSRRSSLRQRWRSDTGCADRVVVRSPDIPSLWSPKAPPQRILRSCHLSMVMMKPSKYRVSEDLLWVPRVSVDNL